MRMMITYTFTISTVLNQIIPVLVVNLLHVCVNEARLVKKPYVNQSIGGLPIYRERERGGGPFSCASCQIIEQCPPPF